MRIILVFLMLVDVCAAGVCPVPTVKAKRIFGTLCFQVDRECRPIPNSKVIFLRKDSSIERELTVPEDGKFDLKLTEGQHRIRFIAPAFMPVDILIERSLARGEEKHLKIILGSNAILPCGGGRVVAGE